MAQWGSSTTVVDNQQVQRIIYTEYNGDTTIIRETVHTRDIYDLDGTIQVESPDPAVISNNPDWWRHCPDHGQIAALNYRSAADCHFACRTVPRAAHQFKVPNTKPLTLCRINFNRLFHRPS
jgi:hypothetical protein